MNALVAAPILLPLAAALLALLVPRPSFGRRIGASLVFLALLVLSLWLVCRVQTAGPLALSWGGWVVPYGIVLVADTLAAIMLCLSSLTGLACVLYGFAEAPKRDEHPLRLPLLLLLTVGVHIAFLTGDLFNLFVAFEVLLLASYALMTLEADRRHARSSLPYVTINLVGSALFLCACAFTYGLFGTLNFAGIAVQSSGMVGDARVGILALMLILVFALKAGLFPLYYWLPVSYPPLPPPVAAFYAGVLTKVGIYVLLRIIGTVLPPELTWLHTALAWAAGLTMILGVLGAVAQDRIQSILSYHIVSQIGYMALGIGLFSLHAFAAAIFFVIHQIVVKSALFLVGGVIVRVQGTDELDKTGGLWEAAPGLSLVFLLHALSLAGVPPLSGFWGKLLIIKVALSQGQWVLVLLALVAGVLTLLSMLKIWLGAFWRATPDGVSRAFSRSTREMTVVAGVLAVVSLGIGLGAGPVLAIAEQAARETLDRRGYINTVHALNLQPEEGKHP